MGKLETPPFCLYCPIKAHSVHPLVPPLVVKSASHWRTGHTPGDAWHAVHVYCSWLTKAPENASKVQTTHTSMYLDSKLPIGEQREQWQTGTRPYAIVGVKCHHLEGGEVVDVTMLSPEILLIYHWHIRSEITMNRQVRRHWSTILHARILFPITPHHVYISGFFFPFNTTFCLSYTYILLCKCKIMQSHTICSHKHIFPTHLSHQSFPSPHFCS